MPIRRESISKQLARIRRMAPNRDPYTGMLYKDKRQLSRTYKKVTLIGLFVSDQDTFLVRPHLFESKKKARTPEEWDGWFRKHYGDILPQILDGMADRSDKFWRLYRIVGWLPNDHTRTANTKTRKTRNKTKPRRGKNGRSNTRRG